MVAFDDGEEKSRVLDGKPATTINANLTATADIGSASKLPCNAGVGFMGTTKQGPFDISEDLALQWLCQPNPHGRPNSDVVMPWINGMAVTQRSNSMWIIDYFQLSEEDARKYELPFAYVLEHVKKARDAKPRTWYRAEWWQLYAQRPDMRKALTEKTGFIVTPRVSKHRLFTCLSQPINPDCQLIVFARSDDLFFGILHSRFHEVWARAQGTQLREKESGFRYTPTTCFETFPFPPTPSLRRACPPVQTNQHGQDAHATQNAVATAHIHSAIAEAARELNELRENWLNPHEWTRTETLEFPGTVGGPWDRYIDPATIASRGTFKIGTVRYPRLVPRDADCEARLKTRTLTKLYNERPAWLAACHEKLDTAVAAAYGFPPDLPDEQILEKLLELNLKAT
jgi:hypothetical protein